MQKKIGLAFILLAIQLHSKAQPETRAWFFLTHTRKVSKNWNVLADVQFRSSDKIKRTETVLLRTALSYNLGNAHAIATGYAYKADWEQTATKLNYVVEHRLYQQYLFTNKIARIELTARARLEQRFVKENETYHFSQRLRGFLSFQFPLAANQDFSKGLYTGLQNELFMNVQHKERVNNRFFDQNRLYISVGYRWSKKVDTEIGYIYWRQKETVETTNSNVVQLMITSEL